MYQHNYMPHMAEKKSTYIFFVGRERDHSEDLRLDRRLTLKSIVMKQGGNS